MSNIARRYHTSVSTVIRKSKVISYSAPDILPDVLSIDEFKGNVGNKFQCILTDAKNKRVIDILPTRNTDDIFDYFSSFPLAVRDKVNFIVMDMSTQFRSIAQKLFPKARIVADKFHVSRLVNQALEDVRKTEQKKFVDIKRRYFKNNRYVLLKASKKLSPEEHIVLNRLLSNSPKLETAYYLKEYFFSIMYEKNKPSQLKMLEIWAALDTGYSNGYTEGCNNKIKVFKRVSYGFRNFGRFRNRFLHIAANPVSKC